MQDFGHRSGLCCVVGHVFVVICIKSYALIHNIKLTKLGEAKLRESAFVNIEKNQGKHNSDRNLCIFEHFL